MKTVLNILALVFVALVIYTVVVEDNPIANFIKQQTTTSTESRYIIPDAVIHKAGDLENSSNKRFIELSELHKFCRSKLLDFFIQKGRINVESGHLLAFDIEKTKIFEGSEKILIAGPSTIVDGRGRIIDSSVNRYTCFLEKKVVNQKGETSWGFEIKFD